MLRESFQLTPSSGLPWMLLQTFVFTFIWLNLHRYIHHSGPIATASTATRLNSRLYSLASLALLFLVIFFPSPTTRTLYHASKFYEYVDILNVTACGGSISLHFAFHHLTTPYLTFFRVLGTHHEGWRWFAASNAAHHVLMYAYFGGLEMVRPLLPWTGTGQLLVGIGADVTELCWGQGVVWSKVVSVLLLGCYLVLSMREMEMRKGKVKGGKEKEG